MPDWDEDSTRLRANLTLVLRDVRRAAKQRETPSLDAARRWHIRLMAGLNVLDPRVVGAFRGEPGLQNLQVKVGPNYGVASTNAARELTRFEAKVRRLIAELDALLPDGEQPDTDQLAAILDLCAWVHSEWIRIHPFANGNGRTARIWANFIAMRYGLPPFVRLHPRPDAGYSDAGERAMSGDWQATALVFRRLLDEFLDQS